MTLHRYVRIVCDSCGTPAPGEERSGVDALEDARKRGWQRVHLPAAHDYCPTCWARIAAAHLTVPQGTRT